MRCVKVGAVLGAWWLLGSCTVPSDSPVQGSKLLSALSGREIILLCDWARDYRGGYYPNSGRPETDEGEREVWHRCPVTEEDLWERTDEETYLQYNEEACSEQVSLLAACGAIVDEYEAYVRTVVDAPCKPHVLTLGDCVYTYLPEPEN